MVKSQGGSRWLGKQTPQRRHQKAIDELQDMPREDPSHGEEKPVHDTAGQKFLSAGRSGVHTPDGPACARKQLFDVRQQPGDRDYKRRTVRHTRRTTATARRRKGAATCERRTVRRSLDDKNREGKKEDGRSNAIRPACNAGRSGVHNERLTRCMTRFCIKFYEACTTMLMCQNKRISTWHTCVRREASKARS